MGLHQASYEQSCSAHPIFKIRTLEAFVIALHGAHKPHRHARTHAARTHARTVYSLALQAQLQNLQQLLLRLGKPIAKVKICKL